MRITLWAALPLMAGCIIVGVSKSNWYDVTPVMKPADQVLAACHEAIHKAGYKEIPGEDPYQMATEWMVLLSSHLREGIRTRVEIQVTVADPRGLTVRVREFREINNNASTPTSEGDAEWIPASLDDKQKPRMGETAIRVQQILKFRLMEN